MSLLTSLASTIAIEAKRLADYIEENGLPSPAFSVDAPGVLPILDDSLALRASQSKLYEAAQKLSILALGPAQHLQWQSWNQFNQDISLRAIVRFKLADAVPPTDSTTFASVAAASGLSEALVTRLIRHAALYHVFHEPWPGTVAHTCASLALRSGEGVRDWLDMTFEEFGPAAQRTVDALSAFPGSQEPHENGFGLAFGGQNIFDYMGQRPERARVYGGAMAQLVRGRAHRIENVVQAYDWKSLGRGTLVDVGGSHGHVSIAIARVAPELRFVVQDLPETAEQGRRMLDPELADRVSFVGHDMHEAQTVVADAYLFRHVFPNWPQKYCVKFLKNLVPAMRDGAKVLIHEACLSDAGNVPYLESRFIRNLDMCMMSVHSGRERTEGEWEQIFALVDKRFRYCGARKSADGAGFCIYEAVWEAGVSPDRTK